MALNGYLKARAAVYLPISAPPLIVTLSTRSTIIMIATRGIGGLMFNLNPILKLAPLLARKPAPPLCSAHKLRSIANPIAATIRAS